MATRTKYYCLPILDCFLCNRCHFGEYISNPDALGLDFAITAMFIFLCISQFEGIKKSRLRIYIVLIVCVIVMMLLLSSILPSYVAILIAAIVAALLGVVMDK